MTMSRVSNGELNNVGIEAIKPMKASGRTMRDQPVRAVRRNSASLHPRGGCSSSDKHT